MSIAPVAGQQTLVARVHRAIFDAICDGRLKPGEPLRQERLAEMLGVSRQPIHEALALLGRQGIVVEHGRRGVRVAPLDPSFILQLYAVRGVLEGLAAREAAERTGAAAQQAGRALIAAGRRAVAAGDVAAMIAADAEFHGFVYEQSGNPMIARTLDLHWMHIRRAMGHFMRMGVRRATSLERIWSEHAAILGAILAGDPGRADLLAREHAGRAAAEMANGIAGAARAPSAA